LSFGVVTKRRCAPLEERWRIPREGCLPLERWHPSSSLTSHMCHLMEDGERWQPHLSHLAKLFSPSGAPSLLGKCAPSPYLIQAFTHCKLVGALVKLLVGCIVIYHSHWNKKALEATTWCKALLCGSSMFKFV
jgi:hypothetical protein